MNFRLRVFGEKKAIFVPFSTTTRRIYVIVSIWVSLCLCTYLLSDFCNRCRTATNFRYQVYVKMLIRKRDWTLKLGVHRQFLRPRVVGRSFKNGSFINRI